MSSWINVGHERIVSLTDEQLRELMFRLLRASAYEAGCDVSKVTTNARLKARDEGCDAYTPPSSKAHVCIKPEETCWQFKAGKAGEPKRIADELEKPIPQDIIRRGGWLIVIASACTNGRSGIKTREKALKARAKKLKLSTERIAVYSADQLAGWASEYAAASCFLYGISDGGILPIDEWEKLELHQIPFTPAGSIGDELDVLREQFFNRPFEAGEPGFCYVYGQPGAGKSRFVLEAARSSNSKYCSVYLPSATETQFNSIASFLNENQRANLIVIADEVLPGEQVANIARTQVDRFKGRLRVLLITSGTGGTAPNILKFRRMTDDKQLGDIIGGWFPHMPREHIAFVVNQAENNVKMARLVSEALERGDITSTSDVFRHQEIATLLDRVLGNADREALQVVAVATSVGWTGAAEVEGRMISEKFGLTWGHVQSKVYDADRTLGIAPKAGSRRYISPTPLGKYLAQSAWISHTDAMRTLARELPEPGRSQFLQRLQDLGSDPGAEMIAREEVERFKLLDNFRDEADARLFRTVAMVLPELALSRLVDVLKKASIEEIQLFDGDGRRELIWELDKLSWPSKNFRNAVWALALLSAGENESIANNATGVLRSRFQIHLGGTSLPYAERLEVLDEIWQSELPGLTPIVLNVLRGAADEHVVRFDSGYSRSQVLEPEWFPKTNVEAFAAVNDAILLAQRYFSEDRVSENEKACVELALSYIHLLDVSKLFEPVSSILKRTVELFPKRREEVRLALRRHLSWRDETNERGKNPLPATMESQKALYEELRDKTFDGRIFEFVGQPSWEADEKRKDEMSLLAKDIINDPSLLDGAAGSWLTAGSAGDPWAFGRTLAGLDENNALLPKIWANTVTGGDTRLLGGYLKILEESGRKDFVDKWIDDKVEHQDGIETAFAVTTKLNASMKAEARILKILKSYSLSERSVYWLKYGEFMDVSSLETFCTALELLISEVKWKPIALEVFAGRLMRKKDVKIENERLVKIASDLISDASLLHKEHVMSEYEWIQVAEWLLPLDPIKIAETLLDAHLGKDSTGTWFLKHSQASKTFNEALSLQPEQVWEMIAKRLDGENAFSFTIGFPEGIIETIPAEIILDWASKDPERRVRYLTRVISIDPDQEDSLGMKLLAKFGKKYKLGSDFTAAYVTGSWSGEASDYYARLAKRMEDAIPNTKNPTVLRWLEDASRRLRKESEREREKEEEERVMNGG